MQWDECKYDFYVLYIYKNVPSYAISVCCTRYMRIICPSLIIPNHHTPGENFTQSVKLTTMRVVCFLQAVYRKLTQQGLSQSNLTDPGTRLICRRLMALPVLPHEHIRG